MQLRAVIPLQRYTEKASRRHSTYLVKHNPELQTLVEVFLDIVLKFTLIVNKNGFFCPDKICLDTKNSFLQQLEARLSNIQFQHVDQRVLRDESPRFHLSSIFVRSKAPEILYYESSEPSGNLVFWFCGHIA